MERRTTLDTNPAYPLFLITKAIPWLIGQTVANAGTAVTVLLVVAFVAIMAAGPDEEPVRRTPNSHPVDGVTLVPAEILHERSGRRAPRLPGNSGEDDG